MYRPDNWPKNPCDGCEDKKEDRYGLFCSWVCNKGRDWQSREWGADALLEGLWKMAKESPTGVLIFDSNLMEIYARVYDLSEKQ